MYIVGLRHRGTRPPEPLASLGEGLGIVLQYVSSEVTCLLTIASTEPVSAQISHPHLMTMRPSARYTPSCLSKSIRIYAFS
jgi:hypothetical protein